MVGRINRRLLLKTATAVAILSACGSATVNKEAPVEMVAENTEDDSNTSATITLYSGRSERLVAPILARFEEESGIDVRVKYAKTPALAATLLEEGEESPADIFYAQDPGGLGATEDLLATLPADVADRVPAWAQHTDRRWVGITGRARSVVYNTRSLTTADLPDDMFGFTDSEWRGRIGWAPTNGSFQTMVTAMRALWGEERTERWLVSIKKNEPTEYPNNSSQVAAAGAGEIDVGFVNHYYLHRAIAEAGEGFKARNYHPRSGGPGALIMVSGAGIMKNARNPESSVKLLQFLLADETQQSFAATTYEYPLVPGIAQHPDVEPLESLNHPEIAAPDLADLNGTQELLRKLEILP